MRKWIWIAVGLLLALVASLLFRDYTSPDQQIRRAVARIGSELTGVEVRLERASVSRDDGTGVISGFSLANPHGYGKSPAISADTIKFALELDTLQRDAPTIRTIAVVSPLIRYEAVGNGSNLTALLEQVQRSKPKTEVRLIVDRVVIRDARLTMEAAANKEASEVPPTEIALPEMRLSNLGRETGGITGTQLTTAVLESVLFHIRRALPPSRHTPSAGQPASK